MLAWHAVLLTAAPVQPIRVSVLHALVTLEICPIAAIVCQAITITPELAQPALIQENAKPALLQVAPNVLGQTET
jgi:hypothetical protein